MPSQLTLHFLGSPQIYLDHKPVSAERRKAVALLAYLAVEGGPHTRDSMSALLWPDYEQSKAFTNLRHILWEVQQAIGEGWIVADRETIRLNADADISLDIHRFESLLAQSRGHSDPALRISLLGESVKLYRNHFLTGFSIRDAPNFNEWAFAISEDLRRQLGEALTMLSEGHSALGQAEEAIPYARRLVALDSLNESAHRLLMQVYLQAGQHSAALKQYQVCEQILRKEMGVDPQPETYALYKQIRRGEIKPAPVVEASEPFSPRHNLPEQLSRFIGREKEQREVMDLVGRHRLVTLTGPGGIGKTRLSLQVGDTLRNDYSSGVWFIALDSLSDPALVPQAVASIFDIRETTDRPLLEKLIEFLRRKTSLLILDNCEHLLDACADLIQILLKNCPTLKLLATSREALGIAGEATYVLPSLSIPEREENSSETWTEYQSVQLFAERAALALSSFTLTTENMRTVVEICRRVDGIPLAIELAAARVNLLQVEEILKQLHDSFALLARDGRTILPRHQTLRASMDWSWGLLSEAEQMFLRQLSVFAGGWTLQSAQAVCEGDILGLTSALVKKSLIVVDQVPGRETRYHFHEIVREYAHEKFIKSGKEQKVRARHLKYFLSLSEQAELGLRGPARVELMERLHEERNNIRAALRWADQTDLEAGLYLSARLLRYWESSDLREGMHWLETFLHKSESRDFPLARAAALHTFGWLLTWLQHFILARAVTEESLALFRAAGDRRGEADTLISLGNIAQFTDAVDSGTELLHEALGLAQALGDTWRQAIILGYLGWDRTDLQRAFKDWEKAIQLYREVGDQISLANLLSLLAQFRIMNGDIEVGEKHLDESILLWHSNKRANVWEHPKLVKSLVLLIRGEYEQAYALLQEALATAQEQGNRMSYLWLRVRLGYAALRAGHLEEAHDLFVETAQNFHKDGYTIGAIFALEGMASLYIAVNKPERAARLVGLADAVRKKIHDTRLNLEQADVDQIIAACLAKMGEVAFSDAYDEGQGMTMDEAVNYILI